MLWTRLKVAAATRRDSAPILAGLREEKVESEEDTWGFMFVDHKLVI